MSEILQSTFSDLGHNLSIAWHAFTYGWFVVLPPMLYALFKYLWMDHIQLKFALSQDWVLLEIIPSKDLEKSPKLMESIFAGMAGTESTLNPFDKYIDGKFQENYSLEIVGDGGTVHFYVRTLKKYRNLVEAHFFAQYPDIEITEVSDYVNEIPKITPNTKWDLWGTDFETTKKGYDAYPIRTYKNFEEDVTGKMIDPLSNLIEVIGKLAPGQQIWLQYVIHAESPGWNSKAGKKALDKIKGTEKKEETIAERLITDFSDIRKNLWRGLYAPLEFAKKEKKEEQPLEFRLSPGEKETLLAVERNLSKIMYLVKMRFIYVGPKQSFDKSFVSSFIGGIKQFNDDALNAFKPEADSKTAVNYVFKKTRLRYRQRKILRRYRNRSQDGVQMVMSTEELATLFHMPDMQVVAPALTRVEAKRGGAPSNLPFE